MEEFLRSPEMDQIEELSSRAFDYTADVFFFPLRHHSPACSFHLRKVIETYRPEAVLIEGPSDAEHLIPYLQSPDSRAPFCIYYSFSDTAGSIDGEKRKYTCYYPFLDFSPELVALREAKALGIPVHFIDLPYPGILKAGSSEAGLRKQGERNSYHDDYLVGHSAYIRELCRKTRCRDYNELWEKFFELDGIRLPTGRFLRSVFASCYLARLPYTEEMLRLEACTARESFMNARIREERTRHQRLLVVSGGFHTPAFLASDAETPVSATERASGISRAYAMAYSFAESDQLSGYASGMPHPAYYQAVWEALQDGAARPFEHASRLFIMKTGQASRKEGDAVSLADEIEAFSLLRGLAALREKPEGGGYELQDAVRSAFVKGDLNLSSDTPLRILASRLRGRRTGTLCPDADLPPLVHDFRQRAEDFRLKIQTTAHQDLTLQIYRKPRHRRMSEFLHTLLFLETGFCRMTRGPDFVSRKNAELVRELWTYRFHPSVESRLVELSVYGGTVKEAAGALLAEKLSASELRADTAAELLSSMYLMDIPVSREEVIPRLEAVLGKEGLFLAASRAACQLDSLSGYVTLLANGRSEILARLLSAAWNRAVVLTRTLTGIAPEEEDEVIDGLKDLSRIALRHDEVDGEAFAGMLSHLIDSPGNAAVHGAVCGLLSGMGMLSVETVLETARGYFLGTDGMVRDSARFVKGLLASARAVFLIDNRFAEGLSGVLASMDEDTFLSILPDFRLAFSGFTPYEIDRIAGSVAGSLGVSKDEVLHVRAVDPQAVELGSRLDRIARERLSVLEGME